MKPGVPVRNILVVRLSSIGDIILTTPVVAELRKACPGARIDFCTRPQFTTLLDGNPAITTVVTPDRIPDIPYDLAVDLQNSRRSRALVRSLGIREVRRYHKRNWKKLLLVRCRINLHGSGYHSVVERYRAALGSLVPSCASPCALYPSKEDRAFADSVVGKSSAPLLAVCFGANHMTKRYPETAFAAVLARVASERDLQVLLLGGAEDVAAGNRIIDALPTEVKGRVRLMAGRTTLMQGAALLERVDLVLTNDTGLMHMASAFGRHLLVLFGSSVREFGFLPWAAPFDLFEVGGLSCRPCSHIGRDTCPKGHFRCMRDIDPARVAARITELLKPADA